LWYAWLCFGLSAFVVARWLVVLPSWLAGAAPAYPGAYERRASNALITVGLLGWAAVAMWPVRQSRTGRVLLAAFAAVFGAGTVWALQLP
jgi:hypothetical protein